MCVCVCVCVYNEECALGQATVCQSFFCQSLVVLLSNSVKRSAEANMNTNFKFVIESCF